MERRFVFIMLILILQAVLGVSHWGIDAVYRSATRSISINHSLTITNRTVFTGATVLVSGDITITSGGELILRSSTLYLNLSYSGEYHIDVMRGGYLELVNSRITAYNINNKYFIRVYSGGRIHIVNSEISYAGYAWGDNGDRTGIWINGNNATILNSTFMSNYYGIFLYQANNVTIAYCGFSDIDVDAIYLYHSTGVHIYRNVIESSSDGISLYSSNKNTIENNSIVHSNIDGMHLYQSNHIVVRSNRLIANGVGIYVYSSKHITIEDNYFDGNKDAGIKLDTAKNIFVTGNNIYGGDYGIWAQYISDGTIAQNYVKCSLDSGIRLFSSHETMLSANIIFGSDYALKIDSSRGISIENQTTVNISMVSLLVTNSIKISINSSNIFGSAIGVASFQSSSVRVMYSDFVRNEAGIKVDYSSSVDIYFSIFRNNTFGLQVYGEAVTYRSFFHANINASVVYSGYALFRYSDFIGNIEFGLVGYSRVDARYNYWGGTPEYKNISDSYNPEEIWGNVSYVPWLDKENFDTTPPIFSVSGLENMSYLRGFLVVEVNATDNVGVSRVEVYVDGEIYMVMYSKPYRFILDTTSIGDGYHSIDVVVYDYSWNSVGKRYRVVIDNTPPKITDIIFVKRNSTEIFGAKVSDIAVSSVVLKYRVDNQSWDSMNATYNGSYWLAEISLSRSAIVDYYFLVRDKAGNTNTSETRRVTVSIDNPPSIREIRWYPAHPYYGDRIHVIVDATDDHGIASVYVLYYMYGKWSSIEAKYNNTIGYFEATISLDKQSMLPIKVEVIDLGGNKVFSDVIIINVYPKQESFWSSILPITALTLSGVGTLLALTITFFALRRRFFVIMTKKVEGTSLNASDSLHDSVDGNVPLDSD